MKGSSSPPSAQKSASKAKPLRPHPAVRQPRRHREHTGRTELPGVPHRLVARHNRRRWARQLRHQQEAFRRSATIPDGTEFQVQVDVDSPIDSFAETYVLKVPLGGEPISGNKVLPAGTTVTLSEPTFPELDGITFGEPRFSSATAGDPNVAISADGTKATITTIADTNVAVVLTNTANEVPPTTPETTPPTSTPETTPETTPPTTTPATPTTTPVTPTTPATPPSVRTTPTPEVPSTSVPRTPTGLDETPTEVARAETPAPTTPSQPAEKTLANTGATYTQWALAIGGLAVALGFVLIRRARKA
ncbi:LPXTG cell wall anchor domain-containing protein [Corynebacterium renale]|uniref:LPXTG cell wall anchor domain-containing protein n=1 Tax=Corynebacterium renale TaxID=1724 RepID=UPI00128B15F8|nr:LPXTG cell wall anchor domain-containing protein [Corynebacterium renale]